MNLKNTIGCSAILGLFAFLFHLVTSGKGQEFSNWLTPVMVRNANEIVYGGLGIGVLLVLLYGLWRCLKALIGIHRIGWRKWFREDFGYAIRRAAIVFAALPTTGIALMVLHDIFPLVVCLGICAGILYLKKMGKPKKTPQLSSHGTSRWATVDDLRKAGMV
jgi:hypothetical protein